MKKEIKGKKSIDFVQDFGRFISAKLLESSIHCFLLRFSNDVVARIRTFEIKSTQRKNNNGSLLIDLRFSSSIIDLDPRALRAIEFRVRVQSVRERRVASEDVSICSKIDDPRCSCARNKFK